MRKRNRTCDFQTDTSVNCIGYPVEMSECDMSKYGSTAIGNSVMGESHCHYYKQVGNGFLGTHGQTALPLFSVIHMLNPKETDCVMTQIIKVS